VQSNQGEVAEWLKAVGC